MGYHDGLTIRSWNREVITHLNDGSNYDNIDYE